jgi:hypothetical protein
MSDGGGARGLLDDARQKVREADDEDREGSAITRRIMVAFVLSVFLAVLSFVLLPKWGVHLPPMIPVLGFIVILVGTILGSHEAEQTRRQRKACECEDDGRPMCCGGPRPMRMFRDE